jgi:hypothetical protein
LGCDDLDDRANWEHLSLWELVLRLVDFAPLRPWLAWRLGWTSARGQVPFDPVSLFLLLSWQLVHGCLALRPCATYATPVTPM